MSKLSLEKLIDSLSTGELRAVSLAIKTSKQTQYLELFQSIKKGQDTKTKFDNKQLQRRKYVYDFILETLRKTNKGVDSRIINYLLNTETLFKRQFIKEAQKEINKGLKLAEKFERFGFLMQIIEWKKKIGFYSESFTTKDIQELTDIEEYIILKQQTFLKAKGLYNEILERKKEMGYISKEKGEDFLKRIESNQLHSSRRSQHYNSLAKIIYFETSKQNFKEYELTKELIRHKNEVLEENEYIQLVLEHLTSCICIANFIELECQLNTLNKDFKNGKYGTSHHLELKLFYYNTNYELRLHAFMGETEKLIQKIKEVEEGLIYWKKSLSKEMTVIINNALILAYYHAGNSKRSEQIIQNVLNDNNPMLRKDAYENALFFDIIHVFDSGDLNLQNIYLSQISKYCSKYLKENNFQTKMTNSFKDYLSNEDENAFFNKVILYFEKYSLKIPDDRYYSTFHFSIYLWAISKIKGIDIATTSKQWFQSELNLKK